MRTECLIKNYLAGAVVAAFRIIKCGADDTHAIQAAGSTDRSIGVSTEIGASQGGSCDVVMLGIAGVEYGGTITRGDVLTSDADGKAVKANPATGAKVEVIGVAMESGVSGDIGSVFISPMSINGILYALTLDGIDLVGTKVYRVVAPMAGTITAIYSVIDGALTTGNATLTAKIGTTAVTGGVITITQAGSAAGDVDSAVPSAANVVAAGDVFSVTVGGTNDASKTATVTVLIAP